MFRKRNQSEEAEGHNRIAQMIEERQRELAQSDEGDQLLEDTILMGSPASGPEAQTRPSAEAPLPERSVSLFGVRGPARPERIETAPLAMPAVQPLASSEQRRPPASIAVPEPAYDDEPYTVPYAPAVPAGVPSWTAAAPAVLPQPATPAMPVPDLGRSHPGATLVAADAVWEGKLRSQGDVRVEGVLRGEVETTATLIVAAQAQVHGIIHARNIMLGGDVEGEISCEQRLEILPGGSARGQIDSGTLVVHEGAYIDSRFHMRRDGQEE